MLTMQEKKSEAFSDCSCVHTRALSCSRKEIPHKALSLANGQFPVVKRMIFREWRGGGGGWSGTKNAFSDIVSARLNVGRPEGQQLIRSSQKLSK